MQLVEIFNKNLANVEVGQTQKEVVLLGQQAQVKERDGVEARLKELDCVELTGQKILIMSNPIFGGQLGDKGFGVAGIGAGQSTHPTQVGAQVQIGQIFRHLFVDGEIVQKTHQDGGIVECLPPGD